MIRLHVSHETISLGYITPQKVLSLGLQLNTLKSHQTDHLFYFVDFSTKETILLPSYLVKEL